MKNDDPYKVLKTARSVLLTNPVFPQRVVRAFVLAEFCKLSLFHERMQVLLSNVRAGLVYFLINPVRYFSFVLQVLKCPDLPVVEVRHAHLLPADNHLQTFAQTKLLRYEIYKVCPEKPSDHGRYVQSKVQTADLLQKEHCEGSEKYRGENLYPDPGLFKRELGIGHVRLVYSEDRSRGRAKGSEPYKGRIGQIS